METEVETGEGSVEEGKGKEKADPPLWGRRAGLQKRPFFCYHAVKQTTAEAEKGPVRKYSIHKVPGAHLTFDQREKFAADWNRLVKRGPMPTMRGFAKAHGLAVSTWSREFNRGRTGETVPDLKHPGRWIYSEYDPGKAQDAINAAAINKGTPMKVTNLMTALFTKLANCDESQSR